MLANSIAFDPLNPKAVLSEIPARAGVFALFAADERAEPYVSRTPNLHRRLSRFLDARPTQSKRLRLTEKIARIEWSLTGSDFESLLLLYRLSAQLFGDAVHKRMHLRAPFFLRMAMENAWPRVYVTNRITKSAQEQLFGPFPSRATAEKFADEMLNFFLLRRCHEDLHPDPAFPGCIYSEMKMCLAPCFKGCTDERYAEEAANVYAFLKTRGASLIQKLAAERDTSSAGLDFEKAAQLHAKLQKVESVASLVSPAVQQLSKMRALVLQPSAVSESVAIFLLSNGVITGPAYYAVSGMRLHNEHSGSTSLYVAPVAVEAVPLATSVQLATHDVLQERLEDVLARLELQNKKLKAPSQTLSDYLCLFKRWYYRPQTQRTGEIFFADEKGEFQKKQVLRGISRVFSSTQKEEAGDTLRPA
ncbi:MAG TPA: excinuclease ABC subunit C [Pseudacidobacterium sp.]|nr:excinuclease ABC subunit C [Pseudacidobacterium sp.]